MSQMNLFQDTTQMFTEYVESVKHEKQIDQALHERLGEFSHRHIAKMIAIQLLVNNIDLKKWHALIYNFVLAAVENIRPS